MLVTVPPGATALERMPLSRYMTASDLVSPAMPCLEAVYAAPAALPLSEASEAVKTTAPFPAASMWGSTARVRRNGAVRLMPMTRSHSSSPVSAAADMLSMTPALLTRTSIPPNSSAAVSATRSTTAWSRRSPITVTAVPPARSTSSATDRAAASATSAISTRAPSRANSRAVARPMPDPAPVTMTLRPGPLALTLT